MSERLEMTLVVVALVMTSIVWWTQYATPKYDTLRAASNCMDAQGLLLDYSEESRAAWEDCIQESGGQYGSEMVWY